MRALMQALLRHRAASLLRRLRPHLPATGTLLDVGSGTGHNAWAIERATALRVTELDVADLSQCGRPPILYGGRDLPFPDATFEAALLLFALHYVPDPAATLRELRRVAARRVLVMQSTLAGRWAKPVLAAREFVQGRGAFHAARLAGWVAAPVCPLKPRRYFRRTELLQLVRQAGLRLLHLEPSHGRRLGISRDLLVLEPE